MSPQLDYTNDASNHKIIQPHIMMMMMMMMILQICNYDQVPTDVSGHVILGKKNTFQTHCKPKLLTTRFQNALRCTQKQQAAKTTPGFN
jgi:hypothetical protein